MGIAMPPVDCSDDFRTSLLREGAKRKESLRLEKPQFQCHEHCFLPNIRLQLRYHCVEMVPRLLALQARLHAARNLRDDHSRYSSCLSWLRHWLLPVGAQRPSVAGATLPCVRRELPPLPRTLDRPHPGLSAAEPYNWHWGTRTWCAEETQAPQLGGAHYQFLKIEGLGQLARFDPNSMGSYATMYGSDVNHIHGS